MNRYQRFLLSALAIVHIYTPACWAANKPNLVFILADDLGYGDLGCFGQQIIQTPRLDRMAREGMRFTQFYAGSTVCAPSRSVLMTGLHTGHTIVRGNARGPAQCLRDEDVTVAEKVKTAGYSTALIGKWGLGDEVEGSRTGLPTGQGFDYFFGYLNQGAAHNYYPDYLYWEFYERAGARAVRQGHWKAVRPQWSAPIELYDLSRDLGEENDLSPRHPDIVKRMSKLMEQAHTPSDRWQLPRKRVPRKKTAP